jgi:hypothetical protein
VMSMRDFSFMLDFKLSIQLKCNSDGESKLQKPRHC